MYTLLGELGVEGGSGVEVGGYSSCSVAMAHGSKSRAVQVVHTHWLLLQNSMAYCCCKMLDTVAK